MQASVTAAILARDAERSIQDCIRHVAPWVDEVLVLDGGSADRTAAIAGALGVAVHHGDGGEWAGRCRRALELAAHDWVFVLNADELVGDELGRALLRALAKGPDPRDGFAVRGPSGAPVRLVHRDYASVLDGRTVGRALAVAGRVHRLRGSLLGHDTRGGARPSAALPPGKEADRPAVLFIDQTGELGGAELILLDVARAWGRFGRVALFADGPFRRALEDAGVTVTVLGPPPLMGRIRRESGLSSLLAGPGLLWLAGRLAVMARGCDVILANSQKAALVGALAGRLAGRPVVWHLHDILTNPEFSRVNRAAAVGSANRLVSRVIAVSDAVCDGFVACGGRADLVRVVPNGIAAGPQAGEGADVRAAFGLPAGPVVGVFGRLCAWKGQHVLVQALAALPGVGAVFVGAPLFGEDAYEERLRRLVDAAGLGGRVRFLGFRHDVAALMAGVDIVAHTSISPEPFGRVVVEGMLAGRPVIATDAGGPRGIIEHGVSGLLVPPGDADALAAAIRTLAADPGRRRALAEAGRRRAVERFSLAAMLQGVAAVIREAATAPEAGRGAPRPSPRRALRRGRA